jgi:DNA replication protein DnaC
MRQIAVFELPEILGNLRMVDLAHAHQNPKHEFREMVEAECSQGCGKRFQVMKLFSSLTACDECRAREEEKHRIERAKGYWESICPAAYRKTELTHPDFPKAQWEATKDYRGGESLLFFGPSRKGKTRLAMVLLKRCLIHCNMTVAALWEEDIEQAKSSYDRKALIDKWGKYDLLLMDDALLGSAKDDRTTAFLKNLIDYRLRHERHMIITSQIGSDDYKASAEREGKQVKKQDTERIEALLARVKELCRVVSFAEVQPKADEEAF